MLAGLASNIRLTGRPAVPKGPASPKTEEGPWSHGGAPAQPAIPGPSHVGGPVETEGDKPLEQEAIDLDATIPAYTSEDVAAVVISDDEVTSFPGGWPEAVSTPKLEVTGDHKQPSEDTSPRSPPQKRQATEEPEESPPPHEAALLRGMAEKDILPKRYEVFTSDFDWVQRVRGSLLGLEAGASPSRRDIDNSSCFVPQMVASEMELPEVIAEHWLPILNREGMDKEFLLCNFHHHPCLMRQSFNLKGRCRQLTFCPYCGVINENSDTTLSHVRKHLDLQFVCGGCFSRSFLNGPALNKHMKACASVTTIRDRFKTSRQ